MPRHRSIKSVIVEAIVFIGLLALVGHMSVNFWERFMIHSELTQMKTSLHSLKDTLANIGTAYDNLHKELKDLIEVTEKKNIPTRFIPKEPEQTIPKCTLDRRRLHDIHVQALLLAKGTDTDKTSKVNKKTEKKMQDKNLEPIFKNVDPVRNATTITRYPKKSTGVGHRENKECLAKTCRHYNDRKHVCQRGYDYCIQQPCKN